MLAIQLSYLNHRGMPMVIGGVCLLVSKIIGILGLKHLRDLVGVATLNHYRTLRRMKKKERTEMLARFLGGPFPADRSRFSTGPTDSLLNTVKIG